MIKKTALGAVRWFNNNYCFGTVSVVGATLSDAGATLSPDAGTLSVTVAAVSTAVPEFSSVLFDLHETIPIPAAMIKVRAIFFISTISHLI